MMVLTSNHVCLWQVLPSREYTSASRGLSSPSVCAGHVQMPAAFRRKTPPMEKPVAMPEEGGNGAAGGSSAPETPEQVFTPKADRHGSRSLDEVWPAQRIFPGEKGSP